MTDQISLGKNGSIGKINLKRLKAGVKQADLVNNKDPRMEAVWKKFDKNDNGKLDRDEIDAIIEDVNTLKGDDDTLDNDEVKNFNGEKLGRKDRKALLEFLKNLDGVTPEDVKEVETKEINGEKVEVVTFNDGHTETYFPNGQKISEIVQENKKTKTTEMNGTVTSEVVTENEGEENEIISTTSTVNGQKQTVINNKGDKTTTTINYNGDKKSDETIVGENSTTVITYDSEGNPAKEVETKGTTVTTYIYQNGQKVLQSVIENKGLEGKETTKTYDTEGGYTQNQNVANGKITTVKDKNGNVTSNVKTETINGKEVSLQLDKDGNIPGVIVQNGESPAAIAKKFGCSVDELIKLNADQLKGKGKKQYFDVGSEIKLPNSVSIEKFNKASEGRKPAEIAKQEYARDAEIRRQKAEAAKQEREYYQKLGVKNFNNKGKKVTADGWGNKEFEVIGDVAYGRQLVKRDGKLYTRSHDGKILREDYLQAHKAFVSKPKNQRNNTASGIKDVTYVKDNNGKVWYFDEKTGKAIVKGNYTQIVKQESAFVANQLHQAATKSLGTDEELLEQGVRNIYSRDILQGVNAQLRAKDSDYTGDAQTMPVEALILDEMSHTAARPLFKTLINSGTMTTQEQAHTVKREIEYEVHGGLTGYTSTSDLNEIMQLCSDRNVRLEVEAQFKKDHPELAENDGSVVRSYIAGDGWNAQEVDQFDANWIKTGAYSEAKIVYKKDDYGNVLFDAQGNPVIDHVDEGDQAHRNGVIGRLVFDYQDKEALNKGLDALNDNPNSFDYQYLDQRAGVEIAKDPEGKYQSRFSNQDNVQRYLAGFHSDETGTVDAGNVSASNTCLFKGIKPARVQAEEALYNAKQGDYSQTFDSMDSETYSAIAELVANGDIEGVKNMTDLYNKALESTKGTTKQQLVKGNAILSGQVQFSDKEIADYCIELMHSIDNNRGTANSSNANSKSMTNGLGGYTNLADTQTEQLKAILQANPQILQSVKQQVENGTFESVSRHTVGVQDKSERIDTKEQYLNLISDTKTIANGEIFLDAEGKQITDPAQIKAIKAANMQSLDAMRQYVAELERDFKKGVDAEGTLSNMGNAVLESSGWGTDRGDVANEYRNAKLMLSQFEAAAQGKLRDSEGNVISAQDLAQQMMDKQNALAQANSDYKQSVAYAKMGIVMAPVIAVTAGAGTSVAALGGGTVAVATGSGLAAGATTYGMNALEYNTSYTGNTAEAREQNLEDSIVAAGTTAIGVGQGAKISQLTKNMAKAAGMTEVAANVAGDVVVDIASQAAMTGDASVDMSNLLLSAAGNAIGANTSGKKQLANVHSGHIDNNTPSYTSEQVNKAIHRESVESDKHTGYLRKRQQEADKLAVDMSETPITEAELKAYHEEHKFVPVSDEDMPTYQAHQEQVAKDYAEAHRIENNAKITHEKAMKVQAGSPEIIALENEIGALDGQIKRLNQQLAGAKRANQMGRKNGDTIKKLEAQIESLQQKRTAKAQELEAAKKPAEAVVPEKVKNQPDVVETPQDNRVIIGGDGNGGYQRIAGNKKFVPINSEKQALDIYNTQVEQKTAYHLDADELTKLAKKGESYFVEVDGGFRYEVVNSSGDYKVDLERMNQRAKNSTTKWKMHIYADSPQEWANAAEIAMPYLRKNDISYKTLISLDNDEFNIMRTDNGGTQKGKAFTIYFDNEEQFVQTAKALEARFKESGLTSSGTVANEAQIGDSGFLSYRHEGAERGTKYKPDDVADPLLNQSGHFDDIDNAQLVNDYNKVNKEWQKLRNSGDASTTMQSMRERRNAYIQEIRQRGIKVEDDGTHSIIDRKPASKPATQTNNTSNTEYIPTKRQEKIINDYGNGNLEKVVTGGDTPTNYLQMQTRNSDNRITTNAKGNELIAQLVQNQTVTIPNTKIPGSVTAKMNSNGELEITLNDNKTDLRMSDAHIGVKRQDGTWERYSGQGTITVKPGEGVMFYTGYEGFVAASMEVPRVSPALQRPSVPQRRIDGLRQDRPNTLDANYKLYLGSEETPFELDLASLNLRDGQTITVGRDVDVNNGDIKVPDNFGMVSRKHLKITRQGDKFIVEDTSTNGTSAVKKSKNQPAGN